MQPGKHKAINTSNCEQPVGFTAAVADLDAWNTGTGKEESWGSMERGNGEGRSKRP